MLLERLKHGKGVYTSNLVSKSDFIGLEVEVDKVVINSLVNIPSSLNNLKTKIDDSNIDKLKVVPKDLKRLSDVVSKHVVKNIKFHKLNTK